MRERFLEFQVPKNTESKTSSRPKTPSRSQRLPRSRRPRSQHPRGSEGPKISGKQLDFAFEIQSDPRAVTLATNLFDGAVALVSSAPDSLVKKAMSKAGMDYEKFFRSNGRLRAKVSRSIKSEFVQFFVPIAAIMLYGPTTIPSVLSTMPDDFWDKISAQIDGTFVGVGGMLWAVQPAKEAIPFVEDLEQLLRAIDSIPYDIESLSDESRLRVLTACAMKLGENRGMTRVQKAQSQILILRAAVEMLTKRN